MGSLSSLSGTGPLLRPHKAAYGRHGDSPTRSFVLVPWGREGPCPRLMKETTLLGSDGCPTRTHFPGCQPQEGSPGGIGFPFPQEGVHAG